MTVTWIIAVVVSAILVLLTVISVLVFHRRSWQERELMRLAQKVNLAVPEHLENELLRHVLRRRCGWGIGYTTTFIAVFLPLALLIPNATVLQGAVPIVAAFAGGSLAGALSALVDRRRGTFGSPSVGRLGGPSVGDLVPSGLIGTTAIIVGVGVVFAIVAALVPGQAVSYASTGSIALAIAGVATFGTWALAAPAIARSRPIAGDATTLAWSDALRAESIRDLVLLPATAAVFSLFGTVPAAILAFTTDPEAASDAGLIASVLIPVAMMVVLFTMQVSSKTSRHYQRRLWPELAHASTDAHASTETDANAAANAAPYPARPNQIWAAHE